MGAKLRDLVGSRFGNLTVISFDRLTNGQSFWLCRCDCGNEKIISRNHLITGNTKSCGCQQYLVDDLSGKRFGRLTVLGLDHMNWNSISYWLCKCDCGNEVIVARHNLLRGTTKSCGCYSSEMSRDRLTKHGMTGQRLYTIWRGMRRRCIDENDNHYDRYGGRGINVCHEWNDFETFHDWAMHNGYEPGLTIDREDNDGNYCPENCRWVTAMAQANNRSSNRRFTYNGHTKTISEWSLVLNVHKTTLARRIDKGNLKDFELYFGKEG